MRIFPEGSAEWTQWCAPPELITAWALMAARHALEEDSGNVNGLEDLRIAATELMVEHNIPFEYLRVDRDGRLWTEAEGAPPRYYVQYSAIFLDRFRTQDQKRALDPLIYLPFAGGYIDAEVSDTHPLLRVFSEAWSRCQQMKEEGEGLA